jgi:protein-tyrosine phosphatase
MALDYSQGCVNFRDVGECLNLLSEQALFPTQRILRGGKLEFVTSAEQIGNPGTIINLRKGSDPKEKLFGADYRHFPIANDYEKYHTTDPMVRRWLNQIFVCISTSVERFPILFHCTSGKDRTGIVVAALLISLEIDRELVVQEYLFSEGEVARSWIENALDSIDDPAAYFQGVDLNRIRQKLLGN